MTVIQDLPEEIMCLVFSKLDATSLNECQATCRSWYHAAHTSFLTDITIDSYLKIVPFIKSLEFNSGHYKNAVQTISFTNNFMDFKVHFDRQLLGKLIFQFSNLRVIHFNNNICLMRALNDFGDELAIRCPKIEWMPISLPSIACSRHYYELLYKMRRSLKYVDVDQYAVLPPECATVEIFKSRFSRLDNDVRVRQCIPYHRAKNIIYKRPVTQTTVLRDCLNGIRKVTSAIRVYDWCFQLILFLKLNLLWLSFCEAVKEGLRRTFGEREKIVEISTVNIRPDSRVEEMTICSYSGTIEHPRAIVRLIAMFPNVKQLRTCYFNGFHNADNTTYELDFNGWKLQRLIIDLTPTKDLVNQFRGVLIEVEFTSDKIKKLYHITFDYSQVFEVKYEALPYVLRWGNYGRG